MLDLLSVRMFLIAAELGNMTRTALAVGTVQPVVSQRIKSLEARLGYKLLDRTSRFVRLTAAGSAFLPRARALLAAHDAAIDTIDCAATRLSLGLSEHALGLGLESVLRQVRSAIPPRMGLIVRMDLSQALHASFDAGDVDAIIVRREVGGGKGEVLGHDRLGWRGQATSIGPLRMATLGPPCGVREAAVRALDAAGLPWQESFISGSCAALMAGVRAGMGVAPMGQIASNGMPDAGPLLGLPALPMSEIVLFARAMSPAAGAAVKALASAVTDRLAG